MTKSFVTALILVCMGIASLAPRSAAQADRRANLQQAISDRYRLTTLSSGSWGVRDVADRVKRAGGVVIIRKPGLSGALERGDVASFGIREGQGASLYSGKKDQEIRVGEKFYVHTVFVGSDVVSLGLVSVGLIPTQTKTGQLWTTLSFFFPKQVLERGDITNIYKEIDQWLLPEGAFQPGYSEPAVAGPVSAPPAPRVVAAPPSDLKPGMEKEQVIATLGAPMKEASFGSKTWLTYPGMVVVLEQGKLTSVDQTAQPPAKVSVNSEPAGAEVYVDGSFVGSTPSVLPLPPGNYKIEVRSAGYKNWSRDIKTLSGGEINLRAVLEK